MYIYIYIHTNSSCSVQVRGIGQSLRVQICGQSLRRRPLEAVLRMVFVQVFGAVFGKVFGRVPRKLFVYVYMLIKRTESNKINKLIYIYICISREVKCVYPRPPSARLRILRIR